MEAGAQVIIIIIIIIKFLLLSLLLTNLKVTGKCI